MDLGVNEDSGSRDVAMTDPSLGSLKRARSSLKLVLFNMSSLVQGKQPSASQAAILASSAFDQVSSPSRLDGGRVEGGSKRALYSIFWILGYGFSFLYFAGCLPYYGGGELLFSGIVDSISGDVEFLFEGGSPNLASSNAEMGQPGSFAVARVKDSRGAKGKGCLKIMQLGGRGKEPDSLQVHSDAKEEHEICSGPSKPVEGGSHPMWIVGLQHMRTLQGLSLMQNQAMRFLLSN